MICIYKHSTSHKNKLFVELNVPSSLIVLYTSRQTPKTHSKRGCKSMQTIDLPKFQGCNNLLSPLSCKFHNKDLHVSDAVLPSVLSSHFVKIHKLPRKLVHRESLQNRTELNIAPRIPNETHRCEFWMEMRKAAPSADMSYFIA